MRPNVVTQAEQDALLQPMPEKAMAFELDEITAVKQPADIPVFIADSLYPRILFFVESMKALYYETCIDHKNKDFANFMAKGILLMGDKLMDELETLGDIHENTTPDNVTQLHTK